MTISREDALATLSSGPRPLPDPSDADRSDADLWVCGRKVTALDGTEL